jgi:hypothetical protein
MTVSISVVNFTSMLFKRNTQMKSILTLALVGLVASTANAASLRVEMTKGNQTNAIYLIGAEHNKLFNTVKLEATPDAGGTPANAFGSPNSGLNAGVPRPAGEAFTYLNRQLNADPLDGGLGWSLLGTSTTANLLGFSGGPLGANISTEATGLFLGNVQFAGAGMRGTAKVQLSDAAGAVIADLTAPLGIPEPGSLGLVGMGMLALAAVRRRVA